MAWGKGHPSNHPPRRKAVVLDSQVMLASLGADVGGLFHLSLGDDMATGNGRRVSDWSRAAVACAVLLLAPPASGQTFPLLKYAGPVHVRAAVLIDRSVGIDSAWVQNVIE